MQQQSFSGRNTSRLPWAGFTFVSITWHARNQVLGPSTAPSQRLKHTKLCLRQHWDVIRRRPHHKLKNKPQQIGRQLPDEPQVDCQERRCAAQER